MRCRLRTIATCAVLIPYLLALTVGARFHEHGAPLRGGGHSVVHSEAGCSGDCHEQSYAVPSDGEASPCLSADDRPIDCGADGCSVCDFLTQKTIATGVVAVVEIAPLVQTASIILPRAAVRLTLSPGPIRASPIAG